MVVVPPFGFRIAKVTRRAAISIEIVASEAVVSYWKRKYQMVGRRKGAFVASIHSFGLFPTGNKRFRCHLDSQPSLRLISVPRLMKPGRRTMGRTTGQRGEFDRAPPCGREREREQASWPCSRVIDIARWRSIPLGPTPRILLHVFDTGSRVARRVSEERVRSREGDLNNPGFATPIF